MIGFRDEQAQDKIRQLFGSNATLTGTMGSSVARGDVQIIVSGYRVGRGPTMTEAIAEAQGRMSNACRVVA